MMAEEDHRRRAGLFVFGAETTAQDRIDAQHVEEIGGDPRPVVALGERLIREVEGPEGEARDTFEALLLFSPGFEVVLRYLHAVDVAGQVVALQVKEAIRLLVRQAAQHRAIDDRVHPSGERDSERHRDHRRGARAGSPKELAKGVAQILGDSVEAVGDEAHGADSPREDGRIGFGNPREGGP